MYKQSLFLSISKGLKSISALIITMVVARVLSQNDYGIYRQYILISTFFGGILSFGIPTALSYLYRTFTKEQLSKLFTSTTIILLSINIVTFISMLIFKDTFISFLSKGGEIESYYYLLILYIGIIVFFGFLENIYTADNRGYIFAKVNSIYFVLQIITFIYISYKFKDLFVILLVFLLFEMLKGFFLYFYFKKINSLTYNVSINVIKRQLIIAAPIGLSFIAQSFNQYIGSLYVSSKYTVGEFAVYSVGVTDIPLISIITISIATSILPVLSESYNKEGSKKKMLSIWKESTLLGSLFIFPVFWILLFFGEGYIQFIFSSEYLNAKNIYLIFLLKLPLAVTVFGNILIVLNKSRYILFNMIAGIVINLILVVLLDKFFYLEGVALAAVITQFLLVVITLIQIKKVLDVKFANLLPINKLITVFLISGATTLIGYLIANNIITNNILSLFLVGSSCYLVINYVFYKIGLLEQLRVEITKRIRGKK